MKFNIIIQTLSFKLSLSLSELVYYRKLRKSASTLAKAMIRFSSLSSKRREAFPQDGKNETSALIVIN